MFDDDQERSPAELRSAVARALGSDMAFQIVTTGRWEMAGRIAQAYRRGRVFLAGDAAHQLPPTRGGFGANTGIADGWNLAWKLERVLDGRSDTRLLDTYDAERRPVGWLRHQQTFSRPDCADWVGAEFGADPLLGNDAMEFGELVRSEAICGAKNELPPAASIAMWAGQPGTRAPHVWVDRAGDRVSTLDLFGRDYVLLAKDRRWLSAAEGLGIVAVAVASDVLFPLSEPFTDAFGVEATGAVLVRPDGIIAWRSRDGSDADLDSVLASAFAKVAFVPPEA